MLRYLVRGETFVVNTWWAGLANSSFPDTAGSDELSVGRVLVQWDENYTNQSDLVWPEAQSNMQVRSVTIWDAQTGGNMLAYDPDVFASVDSGAVVVVEAGSLSLDMPNV